MLNKRLLAKGFLGFLVLVLIFSGSKAFITGSPASSGSPSNLYSKQFDFLNWNVHWDFELNEVSDLVNVWLRLNYKDIMHIQEDFDYEIINDPYFLFFPTRVNHRPGGAAFQKDNSGLTEFSQYLCRGYKFTKWSSCCGKLANVLDCHAPKGFALIVYYIPVSNEYGKIYYWPLHAYNLHMDAGRNVCDYRARSEQISQLINFINIYSKDYPLIISGDFNCRWDDFQDHWDLMRLIYSLGLSLANNILSNPQEYTTPAPDPNTIDYILYRSSSSDGREVLFKNQFRVAREGNGSDHYPLLANFTYQVDADAFPDLQIVDVASVEYHYYPESPLDSEITAYVIIRNNGLVSTGKSCPVRMTISGQKYWQAEGTCPIMAPGDIQMVRVSMDGLDLGPRCPSIHAYYGVDIPFGSIGQLSASEVSTFRCGIIKENDERNNGFDHIVKVTYVRN